MKGTILFLLLVVLSSKCLSQTNEVTKEVFLNEVLADTIFDNLFYVALKIKSPGSDQIKIYIEPNTFLYHYYATKYKWSWPRYVKEMKKYLLTDRVMEVNDEKYFNYSWCPSLNECGHKYDNFSSDNLVYLLNRHAPEINVRCIVYQLFESKAIVMCSENRWGIVPPKKERDKYNDDGTLKK